LLTAELDPLVSNLHVGAGGGLEKLLLEMISCGRLTKENDIQNFIDCTLYKQQQPNETVIYYFLNLLKLFCFQKLGFNSNKQCYKFPEKRAIYFVFE
jgi:hypothetical protein